ncbi:B-lymphocyte antigen CD19 [Hemicordylus capensis]|uniref:B-lymphocyte antigen CD19 n=1 Tax=Hemicordylus capensis TaxID=884348 RepID=UPI0023027C26|nr:B-lymphocyte antigen CD19 [Hemicordylus capensis]
MVPTLHCQILLWLSWGAATGAQEESIRVIQATESHGVLLPCHWDPALASNGLNLTWLSSSGEVLVHVYVKSHQPEARLGEAYGLQIYNISQENWFTCSWNGISGKNHTLRKEPQWRDEDDEDDEEQQQLVNRTKSYGDDENTQEEVKGRGEDDFSSGHQAISHPFQGLANFSCDVSVPHNWTEGSLLWIQHDLQSQKKVLSVRIRRRSIPYWPWLGSNCIDLLLPSVNFTDGGNYTCQVANQTHHYRLEVMAKSAWLHLGDRHWVIWTVALGYVAACLGLLFCFLRLQRAIRIHRQQKNLRAPARRRFFHAKRNRTHNSNGILVHPANDYDQDPMDAFSYENVLPNMDPLGAQQLFQKRDDLPSTTKTQDEDEEEYECPDSETEQKDDDDNYENTQEEVKQASLLLSDGSPYENNKKDMTSGICSWGSDDPWYANNTQQGPKNLTEDQLAEDGENYENVEEEDPVSPGVARLIAGLRLQLALNPQVDKQDGGSEASTGSQTYEEMNGMLPPTANKTLHLHPNTSNEEDADSYENMESPNNVSSRKEGSFDPRVEGPAFGSTRQNRSIPFGVGFRGGMLCSD